MIFGKKKKTLEQIKHSFGKTKSDYFNFGLIRKFHENEPLGNSIQQLSDNTCEDLDFEELFMYCDRTYSKVGQQFLYHRLRAIPGKNGNIERNEKIISKLTSHPAIRTQASYILSKLKRDDAYYISGLFQDAYTQKPRWFIVIPILSLFTFLTLVFIPIYPKLIILFTVLFIVNIVVHFWNKKNLFQYLDSVSELVNLNMVASNLFAFDEVKTLNPNLKAATASIGKEKLKLSVFRLENKIQGDMEMLFWGLLEILKSVFLLEPLLLFGVLKSLDKKREAIREVFTFVGEVDMLISIASLRIGEKTFCIPQIIEDKSQIVSNGMYHPLIENCVPNNLKITERSVLLTGSNMSGKTSFIRAVGLNVITGLTLNTCFAESMTIPRTRIFSAIRISDDLLNQKSYYFEEVLRIKEMISSSKEGVRSLFLLDEIYKGTNTVERISAGKAVLSYLAKAPNMVFVSTHDIELADLLHSEYELFHFSEKVENATIDFDYKLKEGKLKNRNAIRILEVNKYPESIIEEANALARNFGATLQT